MGAALSAAACACGCCCQASLRRHKPHPPRSAGDFWAHAGRCRAAGSRACSQVEDQTGQNSRWWPKWVQTMRTAAYETEAAVQYELLNSSAALACTRRWNLRSAQSTCGSGGQDAESWRLLGGGSAQNRHLAPTAAPSSAQHRLQLTESCPPAFLLRFRGPAEGRQTVSSGKRVGWGASGRRGSAGRQRGRPRHPRAIRRSETAAAPSGGDRRKAGALRRQRRANLPGGRAGLRLQLQEGRVERGGQICKLIKQHKSGTDEGGRHFSCRRGRAAEQAHQPAATTK